MTAPRGPPMTNGKHADRVYIFDTTLRDGEQSPGISLNTQEKLEIAHQLARLGVDVIEAGFPITSPGDAEAVAAIAKAVEGPVICGLARTRRQDIDAAWNAVKHSERPRIHTFIATSRHPHRAQAADHARGRAGPGARGRRARQAVLRRRRVLAGGRQPLGRRVHGRGREGGDRGGRDHDQHPGHGRLHDAARVRRDLRASSTASCPSCTTWSCPSTATTTSGMAVANSFAGLTAGARQVECAVNGIGERAGNASLEEIVMLLRTRRSSVGLDTGMNTQEIARTSRLVSRLTGYPVQPNKAIVGRNAFAHEAGIHQDGVLKDRTTYEIMDATTIGLQTNSIVLGKHSGRHALRNALEELGVRIDGAGAEHRVQALQGDRGPQEARDRARPRGDRLGRGARAGGGVQPCLVRPARRIGRAARREGRGHDPARRDRQGEGTGDGPWTRSYRRSTRRPGSRACCKEYHVAAVTADTDALGEVSRAGRARRPAGLRPERLDGHAGGVGARVPARALERARGGRRGRRRCPSERRQRA